ncbi:uncharacterized protein ighd isoform X2 [Ictalurus punctatus]|uniref:Uncharacterized protein ighd isoform X2 n=1 Tax=Ictalurus punctatus TaxID=7998 RepID=A0A9F7QVA6_ICTPU|nr:uncharacterized protein ighd isoform X2 [Ictalurus punctatus]
MREKIVTDTDFVRRIGQFIHCDYYSYFEYWGKGTQVTVTSAVQSAPKSLFPVWQCGSASDGLVTLGCVTRDLASADGLSFIWKDASGSALTDVVQYPAVQATGGYTSVSHVRVKASDWNGNKKFTCEVKNGLGSKDASLQKPAQRVTEPNITMSTNTMDNNVNLLCWLDGFSPKKISVEWYKGNTLHTKKTTMKIFESLNNGEKTFGALSQLSINAEQWNEGTEFTCKATHISKIFSQTWSKCKAEPTSKPLIRLEKPGLMSVLTDSEVTASCVVETVHNTKVSWFVDGKEKTDRVTLKTLDGRTVSNLTISTNDWKNWQTIKCTAAHLCFGTVEKTINILEPVQKTPTVVIRRNLADILKGDSAVLECAARDLPSGELSVILQANGIRVFEPQYVDLPKGVDTLTARFTVSTTQRNKNQRFTCQIQQSRSKQWTSNSIENLFGDPSVELSAVSNTDNSGSITQKLICSGTGFNPQIKWLHKSVPNALTEVMMQGDGRVKVSSEILVQQQEWNIDCVCEVSDQDNPKHVQKSTRVCAAHSTVKPLIRLEKPGLMSVLTDSEVTASCVVETVHNTKVSWFVDGKEKTDRVTLKTLDGRTVSNLTISTNDWKNWQTIKCTAAHLCFGTVEKTINILEPVQKTPTVVIRRNLADILKGDSAVLECAARDLPSGELSVILQANGIRVFEPQYVDLPKGVDTLTARFTVSTTQRNKNQQFTCQIQQSRSKQWTSNSIENLFGDPSVELSAVSNTDNSGSITQKLICSGTGFNPQIKWLHKSVPNALTEVMMQGDGRVKVSSEILVQQQEWNIDCVCEVSDQDNPKHVQKSTRVCAAHSTVKPLIRLEKPGLMSVLTDSEVTASCVVETVLNSRVSWFVDGREKTNRVTLKTLDGRTVSNLTISTDEWKNWQTIKCTAKHPCFDTVEKTINILEPVQKTPTVVIRRNLADILKGDSAVLECAARDLPSGELLVILQANGRRVLEPQYVDLPKGVDTLTARFTVSTTQRNKNQRFTCQIQQSRSKQWTSNSIENLFGDPSVELLVISSVDKSASATQKLLCAATGLNPKIKWLPESVVNALNGLSKVTVDSDGRVKVSSEISVSQQQWNNRVTFTCRVSDQDTLKPVEKSTSICAVTPDFAQKAQVYLLAPSISDMRANHVSVTCLLLGHRLNDFSIVWKIGKNNTSQGVTTQPLRVHSNGTESVRSVLKVPAAKWNAYKTVSCEVTHLCSTTKMEHTISKTRDRKSPTVRILSPSDDDLSGVRNTNLLCLVDGFRPADISVHWELNGRQLDASKFINSPVGNASALGDYSMHSVLILPASKRENSTFSCVVSHESSEKPIRNSINNVYASVTENAPSVELLQGQNKLVCLVYGYSPSAINITWLLNSVSVQHDNSTKSSAKRPDGKFSIKSHLKVQASEWAPGDTYTCQVKHITGIVTRDISKKEFTEETIYFDENTSETSTLDQAEETWNMACAFIILFVISLLYGCSVTLVKVKIA